MAAHEQLRSIATTEQSESIAGVAIQLDCYNDVCSRSNIMTVFFICYWTVTKHALGARVPQPWSELQLTCVFGINRLDCFAVWLWDRMVVLLLLFGCCAMALGGLGGPVAAWRWQLDFMITASLVSSHVLPSYHDTALTWHLGVFVF